MMHIGLIGIGAGAAAALLFASVTSGAWPSIVLFYIAPLPIMIAGLGWSHWAALTGALTGAIGLGLVLGLMFFFSFLAIVGIPAWWLAYLAMLARPVAVGGNGGASATAFEWYPPGRLVLWAAVLAALLVVVAIPNFGTDAESFRAGMHDILTHMLRVQTGTPADVPLNVPNVGNVERFVDFVVAVIPAAAAVLATVTNTCNLWLSARVVKFSGLLKRPWPQISDMRFPPLAVAALAVAMGVSFLGGLVGIAAGVLSTSLLMAYGVLGFAVLHAVTQGLDSRPFILGSAYAAVLVLGWPVLAFCLLGLVETAFNVRDRVARKQGPPAVT